MAFEDIEKKVLLQAKEEAEKLKKEASHEAGNIRSTADLQAKKIEEEILEDAKKASEEEKRKILSPARIKAKNKLLETKQKLIEQVFAEALKDISGQKDSEYKKAIKALLNNVPREGNIIPAKGKEKLTKDAVADAGIKKLKVLDASEKITGGFIFEGEKINIDQSFETILKTLREKIEPEIIEALFGKDNA